MDALRPSDPDHSHTPSDARMAEPGPACQHVIILVPKSPCGRGVWIQSPEAASDSAENQQDDDDENDEADPTTGRVAPAFAMTPSGEGPQEGKDENDKQNGSKRHGCMEFGLIGWRSAWAFHDHISRAALLIIVVVHAIIALAIMGLGAVTRR